MDIKHGGSKLHYGCYITTDSTVVRKKLELNVEFSYEDIVANNNNNNKNTKVTKNINYI